MGNKINKSPPSVVNAPTTTQSPPQLPHTISTLSIPTPPVPQRPFIQIGQVKVEVVQGQLTDEQVDVFVNGVPSDFDLKRCKNSEKLLDAAGSNLMTECQKQHPNGIKVGAIADTAGHNLKCQRVYHVTLPRSKKDGSQNQLIIKTMKSCLQRANKNNFDSIAFPDLGSDIGYPAGILAQLMFTAIQEFVGECANPKITDVVFSVYKGKVFSALQNKAKELSAQGVSKLQHYKVGRIDVTLKVDKLVQQQVDVIVSNSPKSLQLKNGGMAEAILKAGGQEIQDECDKNYPNGINYGDIAITKGHNLPCKFIYHGALPSWGTSTSPSEKQILEEFVTSCLEEANKHPASTKTISFPALGTGSLNYPSSDVAQVMVQCIQDFNGKYPKTELTRISLIIHSTSNNWKTVYKAFCSVLQGNQSNATVPPHKGNFTALYQQTRTSPSYWTTYTNNKTLADWNLTIKPQTFDLVKVTGKTFSAIDDIVQKTWISKLVGHGQDAVGLGQLGYQNIKVTQIQRLENPHLYEEYCKYRDTMFKKAAQMGALKPLGQISQAKKGDILTTKLADGSLQMDIYPDINEHLLFHGTVPGNIPNIHTQGLDARLTVNAFFGTGIYCAESSSKSDQYADPKGQRDLQEKKMLLVRACLGEMFLQTDTSTKIPYCRAPCKSCHKDKCVDTTHNSQFYDSVVVDGGWNFREFIMYDKKACYPEYLITYQRV